MIEEGEATSGVASGSSESDGSISVEPRWPIALALSSFIVVTVVLRVVEPERESLGPHWLVPGIEIALLVALIAAEPDASRSPCDVAAAACRSP